MTIRIRSQEWAAIICMSCVYDMYVYVRVNMYNVHDLPNKETATTGKSEFLNIRICVS